MGNFYLRMPKSKDSPAHWQLVSSQLSGPSPEGQLKLSTYDGWAAHTTKDAPDAELLQLRHPKAAIKPAPKGRRGSPYVLRNFKALNGERPWLPCLYMSTAKNFWTYEYGASDVFDNPRFIADTGWYVDRFTGLQYVVPQFGGPNGIEFVNDPNITDPLPYVTQRAGPTLRPVSSSISAMGWTGNSAGTIYRYTEEILGWYSVPIGMFLEASEDKRRYAKFLTEQPGFNETQFPQYAWAKTGQLYRVEIVARLRGHSVDKSQLPWMNFYTRGETTTGLYPGVGAVRYQGPTPHTTVSGTTTINNDISYYWNDRIWQVPAVRDHPFEREDGDILWTGNLNDLGSESFEGGVGDLHGRHQPELQVTQIFQIASFDKTDGVQYHFQVSPLPPPDPVNGNYYRTVENYLTAAFKVRVVYAF